MSFITQDATLQNEILNLNQSVIDNFSVIQEFLQSNLDTLTLSNELAQAAIDWDLPTQFEDLKNRYDLALFSAVEGLTTFLGEASALQNELQAANNETNVLTLGELLALNNESLLQSLGELLALNSETILLSLSEMLNTHILSLLNAVALLDINNTAALLEIGTSLSTNNTKMCIRDRRSMASARIRKSSLLNCWPTKTIPCGRACCCLLYTSRCV